MNTESIGTPEGHADKAREAEAACKWLDAADHWERARAASIGHKRRDRYEEAADHCRSMAKAPAST